MKNKGGGAGGKSSSIKQCEKLKIRYVRPTMEISLMNDKTSLSKLLLYPSSSIRHLYSFFTLRLLYTLDMDFHAWNTQWNAC